MTFSLKLAYLPEMSNAEENTELSRWGALTDDLQYIHMSFF